MITEVYVNDLLIDIDDDTTIAASYGNIAFGELTKRKGVKTNLVSAPFSPRNKAVFESCEVVGSYSVVPYRKNTFRVDIHGVTVFQGFCIMKEAKESYQIQSFSGASDFYSIINSKKLVDLDLSEFDHIWDENVISASWTNTKGYIYAYLFTGKYTDTASNAPDALLPHIFFHTVIKQIAIDAGYELMGDILTNPKFLRRLILVNKFPLSIMYGGTFSLSALLPDITQGKQWLDFANLYGLQFDINNDTKEIRASYIDGILLNDPEDWTDKVDRSEKPRTSYSLEYGQKSYLRYTSDDVVTDDYKKEILIDDQTLEQEADIYKSPYFAVQPYIPAQGMFASFTFTPKSEENFRGAWNVATIYGSVAEVKQSVWWNGTYYRAIADSTGEEPPNATYWKVIQEKDIWDFRNRPMYGQLKTLASTVFKVLFHDGYHDIFKVVSNENIDWPTIYTDHYQVFNRIIDKTKRVEDLIKLNHSNINQLDFTRAKRIGTELYLVEEVKQFKMNRKDSTLVDLIRL